MERCETVQEVWDKLKNPVWCRGGLCGVNICVDPLIVKAYESAAKNIAWELEKHDYVFRVMPGEHCVTIVYSDEIRSITFSEFISRMATTIYPRGNCPRRLYWKISMLKSGVHCVNDMVKPLWPTLSDVLGCLGEVARERIVVVKAVGSTYFVVLGPIRRIDSPLFK